MGGLTAILLITTLAPLAAAAVRQSLMDQEGRRVTEHVQRLLASSFSPEEFRIGLAPDTRRRLDALSAAAHTIGPVGVRLWNRDGTLLYSNDGTPTGRRMPVSRGLLAAVDGTAAAAPGAIDGTRPFSAGTMYLSAEGYLRYLTFREHQVWLTLALRAASITPGAGEVGAAITESADGSVARVLLPVQLTGASVPAGAFEVSYDFRPLERRVAHLQRGVWTAIPGGILALYCTMLVMVQSGPAVLERRRDRGPAGHAGVFRTLASVVDARDSEIGSHSSRVASHAAAIGRRLGLPREAIAELKMAAVLHDIGKIGIPDAVLTKPGPLTTTEWGLVRRHAVVGSKILDATPLSDSIKQAVRHVHEWWDGTGYPDRLRGEQIPLFARILAVADAFEAMSSDRPYRPALSPADALAELRRMRGVQFDPRLVDVFCSLRQ